MKRISPHDLKTKMDQQAQHFLVDIREQYERDACSIPSVHIPMAEVCERLNELPNDQEIILMCNSGKRAEALGNLLIYDYSKTNIAILEGGIQAWVEQIEPSLSIN